MARAFRCFVFCCLVLLVVSAINAETSEDTAAAAAAGAAGSCIAESDYKSLLRQVEELQSRDTQHQFSMKELDQTKAELAKVTSQLTAVTKSEKLSKSSLTQCNGSLEAVESKLREQKTRFDVDLKLLKDQMAKTEAQNKVDQNRLEEELSKTLKNGEEAAALRENFLKESYLFSFAQFKHVLLKVAAIDKALVLFISSKVQATLPPTLSEDIRVQYAQMRLGLKKYYTTYVESHVNYMTEMTAPYIAVVKKFYDENVSEYVEQTRQVAMNLAVVYWDNGKIQAQGYFEYINGWIEVQFIQPFAQSHQVVQELIPKSLTDRLFALIFLIVAMLISAYFICFILRYCVKLVFKILKIAVLLPCSLAGFLCCRRRKAATKPIATSAKKIVPPVKKEGRKESPVKQQQKSPVKGVARKEDSRK